MRKTSLCVVFLFIGILSYCQNKTNNKSNIIYTWKGKVVTKTQQFDSIKHDYIFYNDSLKKVNMTTRIFDLQSNYKLLELSNLMYLYFHSTKTKELYIL